MKKIISIIIILIVGIGAFLLYFKEGTLPVNASQKESEIFFIQKGESVAHIAKRLENEGLIRNRVVFYLVVRQLGISSQIQAGDFRLSPSMDAYVVARSLTKGTLDVWVTIIEGLRSEEVAHLFSRELNIPEVEFLKVAQEGYLFPDTYLIPKDATAGGVISILSVNFNRKFSDTYRKKATEKGLTDEEVVTIASLVEREARHDEDRKEIASIILKRYRNDWPLQIDATIQYALGYQPIEKTWWKTSLTADDVAIDSPYNSYKNPGLPPTPISNPGRASLDAVVSADINTPYWYYLSDKTGKMHYAKTIEEHNENV